jgi:hypothetical protein
MSRMRTIVRVSVAAVLVAVLAACASDTVAVAPDGFAETLVSSSFRLTTGSVNVEGMITGLGADPVTLQGLVFGGYLVQCTKIQDGNIEPSGQLKLRVGEGEQDITPDRRGAARFGFKNNQTPFTMVTPAPSSNATDYCPSANNWEGTYINPDGTETANPVYRLRDVYLRYSQDDVNWTPVSWSCPVNSTDIIQDSSGKWTTRAENCVQDSPARTLTSEVWDSYFND